MNDPADPGHGGPFAKRTAVIVVPVFDDWASFSRLVEALEGIAARLPEWSLDVLAVDDGSESDFRASALSTATFKGLRSVRVAQLVCNLGHQRAIAVGLTVALQDLRYDAVIVMDGDGEDDPEYVPVLLAEHLVHPDRVITANRTARSESLVFRAFYQLYKVLFRVLTGQRIAFGNFGLIPRRIAERFMHRPEVWNNLAAAIIRTRVPTHSIAARRAARYYGESKMNFVSLILHGLSAMSVYNDVLFVRLLLCSLGFALLSAAGIVAVLVIRLGTELAIPGWASVMVAAFGLMLVQSISLSLGGVFIVLQGRVTPTVIPAIVAPQFLESIHVVHPR